MAIQFACAQCGYDIKVKSEQAGATGHCPKCKAEYRVPSAAVTKVKAAAKTAEEEFDPVAFLSEEPAETARKVTALPTDFGEVDPGNGKDRGNKSSPKSPKSAKSGGVDTEHRTAADVWDQAMAAREMRNALKASVKQAKEQRENVGGIGVDFDLRDVLREYAPKVIGSLILVGLLSGGLYWMFDNMLAGGLKLPKLGKVTGAVTVDGEPLGNAMVYFSPVETEIEEGRRDRARTSIGITDSSGRYQMKYMEGIDGVAVGNCRVWVECMGPNGRPLVPPDYGQAAGKTFDVSAGSQTMNFQMTSKKAAGPTGK